MGLKKNQDFLLNLSPATFLDSRTTEMSRKRLQLKRDWIMRHKADPDLDYDIIFKDDEEIHDQVKMQFSFLAQM